MITSPMFQTPHMQAPTATPNIGGGSPLVARTSKLQEKLARLSAIRRARLFTPDGAGTPSALASSDNGDPLREARTALDTAHEEIARLREAVAAQDSELRTLRHPIEDGGAEELSGFDGETEAGNVGDRAKKSNSEIAVLMQDGVFVEYLVTLCESGADLSQITDTQRAQEATILEYESLLESTEVQSRDLNNRLTHAQQAQQQLDEQINRYEEENLELLEEIELLHDRAVRSITSSPRTLQTEALDRADDPALTALISKQEGELKGLRGVIEAHQKTVRAKTQALEGREERDADRERYIAELEKHSAGVEKERDDAHASIQQLVTEVGEVEEVLHSHLELAQHELVSKSQRHAVTERELTALVDAMTEERDQLMQHVEEQQIALNSATTRQYSGTATDDSLATSIAEAENRCPECLVWKQKHTREGNKLQQVTAKVERLQKDILQERAATDQVVAKWTAHVKSFMAEREEWEKLKSPEEPEPTLSRTDTPVQEAKSKRGLRWSRFLGRSSTKSTSPTRQSKGIGLFRGNKVTAANGLPSVKVGAGTSTKADEGMSEKQLISTRRTRTQRSSPVEHTTGCETPRKRNTTSLVQPSQQKPTSLKTSPRGQIPKKSKGTARKSLASATKK
jgi:hypothetical protein